ncbi:MAG TPA: hypothetical protein VGE02_16635 [Gemmatimonadales bacterium]
MSAVRRLPTLLPRFARWLALVAAVAAAIVLALRAPGSAVGPETERAFMSARAFRAELVERAERPPRTAADTAGLLSLGYLERARVGLGSPFRLADMALADPRLPDSTRRATAWTILTMVFDGDIYQTDGVVLDSAFVSRATANGEGSGAAQLRQIARTVARAGDPRAGELAVRFAYQLAEAERLVRGTAGLAAARAAAQLRDRELARDDLLHLLRAARDDGRDPLSLLPAWRVARRFAVEQPVLGTTDAARQGEAVALAPELLAELRRLSVPPADPALAASAAQAPGEEVVRLLSPRAASHLASLPQVRSLPPRAPVVVTMNASRERATGEDGVEPGVRAARQRLLGAATEEALVAEHARLGGRLGMRLAQATLWAATELRSYGQEEPWFPGSGGPSVAELRARHGIASVSFDREVPAEWRPYYRRMLASAVEDMQRTLPAFSVKGMGVHFGRQPLDHALAVHDPRTRTVFIPLGTGAGAIAHELAHDLDWQMATRTSRRRGEYSTDKAVREQRGRMATALQGLSAATLVAPGPENQYRAPHALRPTEVFAASVDWYVAAALAREGRMNGVLTGVQDALFTGLAAVRPPDARGEVGDATMDVLGEMTDVRAETERWFRETFGRAREPGALQRAALVLEMAPGLTLHPDSTWGAWSTLAAPCVAREVDEDPVAATRRRAVELAAESVARRIVAERGVPLPGGGRLRLNPDGTPVAPGDPALVAPEIHRLRNQILDAVHRAEAARAGLAGGMDLRGRC